MLLLHAVPGRLRRNNGLDAECGQALGRAIGRNAVLTCLDLGDNPLGPDPMSHIAQGLSSSGLRDLRLDMVGMETDGACALAKVRPWDESEVFGIRQVPFGGRLP